MIRFSQPSLRPTLRCSLASTLRWMETASPPILLPLGLTLSHHAAAAALFVAVSANAAPATSQTLDCEVDCPDGTRLADFSENILRAAADGAFIWVEDSCEASCAPIVPCQWPNVPVVTPEQGFRCEPLSGFSAMEPDQEVDLSFGALFDPELADARTAGSLIISGGGFEPVIGMELLVAVLDEDADELLSYDAFLLQDDGFTLDLTGRIPIGPINIAVFVDESQDGTCADETVYVAPAAGQLEPYLFTILWGALDSEADFVADSSLCELLEGVP